MEVVWNWIRLSVGGDRGGSADAADGREDTLLHEERECADVGQRGGRCPGEGVHLSERHLRRAAPGRLLEQHVAHVCRRVFQALPRHKAQQPTIPYTRISKRSSVIMQFAGLISHKFMTL